MFVSYNKRWRNENTYWKKALGIPLFQEKEVSTCQFFALLLVWGFLRAQVMAVCSFPLMTWDWGSVWTTHRWTYRIIRSRVQRVSSIRITHLESMLILVWWCTRNKRNHSQKLSFATPILKKIKHEVKKNPCCVHIRYVPHGMGIGGLINRRMW